MPSSNTVITQENECVEEEKKNAESSTSDAKKPKHVAIPSFLSD